MCSLELEGMIAGEVDIEGRLVDLSTPIVTIYVGNLAPTVDEQALAAVFHPFGHITNVQVIVPQCLVGSNKVLQFYYIYPQDITSRQDCQVTWRSF